MNRCVLMPDRLLHSLSMIVSSHAGSVERSERWAQDRDESYKWNSMASTLSHLAYCKYRKLITKDNPIEVELSTMDWNMLKKVLIQIRKSLIKPHPLFTKIYPPQIKELKARGEIKFADDLKLKIAQDIASRRDKRVRIN